MKWLSISQKLADVQLHELNSTRCGSARGTQLLGELYHLGGFG